MSAILEHFKPPPLASDPPEKTRYWPAPPKGSSGGILQRPNPPSVSESSLSTCPSPISSRVSFAPLPDLTPRKRRNSITLGVAARSATLQRMKDAREAGPRQTPHNPTSRRNPQYTYQLQPGQPRRRARAPPPKDDQVVDLGEVAIDAGKKLWRVINQKKVRKGTASDSGRPMVEDPHTVGGPTVGASGHNTEREISVRGFAVPEEDEEDEEGEEEEEEEGEEEGEEAQHRTEDYVAEIQAMHISDPDECPSAVSDDGKPESIEPSHIHATRLSPPPLFRSESSDLGTSGSSSTSTVSTPGREQDSPPVVPAEIRKDSLF